MAELVKRDPVLFAGNPSAASGRAQARIQAALEEMHRRGWEVDLLQTVPDGGTVNAVREAIEARDYGTVVYLGGDGTFSEVAKGILTSTRRPPLGMIPSGTANDQGKSFGISGSPEALHTNLDIIEARHGTWMDVGKVERIARTGLPDATELIFHSVGWGMQPDVLAQRNLDRDFVSGIPLLRDLYRDQAVYAGATLNRYIKSWIEPTKFDAIVEIDGERRTLTRLTDIVVNATPVYGGFWILDPEARGDDGVFEFYSLEGRRDWAGRALVTWKPMAVLNQQIGLLDLGKRATRFQKLSVKLVREGKEEVLSQVDGEEWVTGTEFRVEVTPGALPILTPRGWIPPWRPS